MGMSVHGRTGMIFYSICRILDDGGAVDNIRWGLFLKSGTKIKINMVQYSAIARFRSGGKGVVKGGRRSCLKSYRILGGSFSCAAVLGLQENTQGSVHTFVSCKEQS